MSETSDQLERLISRFLDDECSPGERRELNAALRSDPNARALYEETAALDREVGHAMRAALGRTLKPQTTRGVWPRIGRVVALAAAACLVLMVWLAPPRTDNGKLAGPVQNGGSWFASPAPAAGELQVEKPLYDRPALRLRHTQRDWIIIPGKQPNEYLLIEVDRVQTRFKGIQEDF